jgi:hypothetical protein
MSYKYGGYGDGGLGLKHKKKHGQYLYPPEHAVPRDFNYHRQYNHHHEHEASPLDASQSNNWDAGAPIVGIDSAALPGQKKRVDAPPRKPIPQSLVLVDAVEQPKIAELP